MFCRQSRLLVRVLGLTLFGLASGVGHANSEVVISDDGRQIQINGDGSWVQLSKDRYATNAAGQRLRLKPDGTWSFATATKQMDSTPLTALTAANESTLFLPKVEILKRKIKRAKSIHAETNTVYHLQVINDTDQTIRLADDLQNRLIAGSSTGARYAIASIEVPALQVGPGERVNITIVAEGAPQWFGVKAMTLEVAANALGNSSRRVLSKSMNEVDKRNVDSF
jgi:hypothetical protein